MLLPPPLTTFSLTLNPDHFTLTITLDALRIATNKCGKVAPYLKKHQPFTLFSHLSVKPRLVQECKDNPHNRIVLLQDKDTFSDKDLTFVEEHSATFCKHDITLTYRNWTKDQILRAIIPDTISDTDIVSSFETIGHIAHLNLKECMEKYKYIIGQVILDKCLQIQTVVNKVGTIHAEYRYFDMELIAGEERYITTLTENKLKFKLDYSKVYWNSKLGTEHARIVGMIKAGQNVLDLFCGIGPFAIPLAKKGCHVFANDLNPLSYQYLTKNIKLNKIDQKYIKCYNQDAREYIREHQGQIHHVLMNLPASAVQFLDMFIGLYKAGDSAGDSAVSAGDSSVNGDNSETNNSAAPRAPPNSAGRAPPVVHCYHFASHLSPEADTVRAVEAKLSCTLAQYTTHLVRKISPTKMMVCISFTVPRVVLEGTNVPVEVLEGTVEVLEGTVEVLEGTVEVLEGTVEVLEGTVEVLEGTVEVLEGTVEGSLISEDSVEEGPLAKKRKTSNEESNESVPSSCS